MLNILYYSPHQIGVFYIDFIGHIGEKKSLNIIGQFTIGFNLILLDNYIFKIIKIKKFNYINLLKIKMIFERK